MQHFILEYLRPYLSAVSMPICRAENREEQINDLPDALSISYPEGEDGFWYDAKLLPVRSREVVDSGRRSPPLKNTIADYLGMDVPCCLVCWGEPAERAHVVPTALGGSMNVRNFALLCKRHHEQAPDIADSEGFWAWVDYAEMRDSGSKWQTASAEIRRWLEEHGGRTKMVDRSEAEFVAAVKFEPKHLYGWDDADFEEFSWELQEEYQRVLEAATGRHFGVERKSPPTPGPTMWHGIELTAMIGFGSRGGGRSGFTTPFPCEPFAVPPRSELMSLDMVTLSEPNRVVFCTPRHLEVLGDMVPAQDQIPCRCDVSSPSASPPPTAEVGARALDAL